MMFITDPRDQLAVASARGRELRAEAAAERLRPATGTRRALAGSLRWAADRLDAAPADRRPVGQFVPTLSFDPAPRPDGQS